MKKFMFGFVFCTLISAGGFHFPSFAMGPEIESSSVFKRASSACPKLVEELAEPLSKWKTIHDRANAEGLSRFNDLLEAGEYEKVAGIMALLNEAEDFCKVITPRVKKLVDFFAELQETFPVLAGDPQIMFKSLKIDESFPAIDPIFKEFILTQLKERI